MRRTSPVNGQLSSWTRADLELIKDKFTSNVNWLLSDKLYRINVDVVGNSSAPGGLV